MVEYKRANDVFALSIRIPVSNTRRTLNVTGLDRRTEYKFRLFCLYGTTRGMPTDWIHAVTRTGTPTSRQHLLTKVTLVLQQKWDDLGLDIKLIKSDNFSTKSYVVVDIILRIAFLAILIHVDAYDIRFYG